jgi:hypothetical protein
MSRLNIRRDAGQLSPEQQMIPQGVAALIVGAPHMSLPVQPLPSPHRQTGVAPLGSQHSPRAHHAGTDAPASSGPATLPSSVPLAAPGAGSFRAALASDFRYLVGSSDPLVVARSIPPPETPVI